MRGMIWLFTVSAMWACGSGSGSSKDSFRSDAKQTTSSQESENADGQPTEEQVDGTKKTVGDSTTSTNTTAIKPKTPAFPDPGKRGPLRVATYTEGLADPAYASAEVYYPTNATAATSPGISISGGAANTKEQMVWLGSQLASHGFIVIAFSPTNNLSVDPNIWATGHLGALNKILAERNRTGSPIAGKLDDKRLAITGFSMGGAGAIIAANRSPNLVRAITPICPYKAVVPTSDIPTLMITGTGDFIAIPESVQMAFDGMTTKQPRAFANVTDMLHADVLRDSLAQEKIARLITSWYKVFLIGDMSYQTFLNGAEADKLRATMFDSYVYKN